jgi:hypothetical protein
MASTLQDLLAAASASTGPAAVPGSTFSAGGVDPLGLRQINFRLMDMVLPGLNNVASRVRPFVLMTWAWRRVWQIVEREGRDGDTDERLRDFVDRIEAIYAWSQFLVLREPRIPGGQALHPLISSESYRFGGAEWRSLRATRRSSTGLISPLNYGPGLRSMNWLLPAGPPGVFRANPELYPALDAFEKPLEAELDHDAFSQIGEVAVACEDVRRWGAVWTLDEPTQTEQEASYERLAGEHAAPARRDGFALVQAAFEVTSHENTSAARVRATMAAIDSGDWNASPTVVGVGAVWRKVQVRQVFRLALEALLHWMIKALDGGPMASAPLAHLFLSVTEQEAGQVDAASWFSRLTYSENPVDHLDSLRDALRGIHVRPLEQVIAEALAFCIAEAPEKPEHFEASERLPLTRARDEYAQWKALTPAEFMARVLEIWVLAQHAYWCVGRGLADARGRGKTLLRLKVVMDEGGWTLTPGTRPGNPPIATPDRLESAIGLLAECGRLPSSQAMMA